MDEPQPEKSSSSNDSAISDGTDESETELNSLIDGMGSCHLAEERDIIEEIED